MTHEQRCQTNATKTNDKPASGSREMFSSGSTSCAASEESHAQSFSPISLPNSIAQSLEAEAMRRGMTVNDFVKKLLS